MIQINIKETLCTSSDLLVVSTLDNSSPVSHLPSMLWVRKISIVKVS